MSAAIRLMRPAALIAAGCVVVMGCRTRAFTAPPAAQTAAPAAQTAAPAAHTAAPAAHTAAQTAAPTAAPASPMAAPDAPSPPAGVGNAQRAWQNWTLNCQGCHRPDGTGSAGTAPSIAGTVARFLSVPGGREYLGRVPGVATSPLSNADLAELMNWMLWRFDKEHLPPDFQPFTAAEIGTLRAAPLRLEASQMRAQLLKKADESAAP